MRVIKISGKRGSGKDTAAQILQEMERGQGQRQEGWVPKWEIAKHADNLKKICAILSGTTEAMQHSQDGKKTFLPEWGMTVGRLQQVVGEKIREINPDAWLISLYSGLRKDGSYMITDTRYPNELEYRPDYVTEHYIIRLEGDPMKQRGDGTRDDNHHSETALDNYPWPKETIIWNKEDKVSLAGRLERWLNKFGLKL